MAKDHQYDALKDEVVRLFGYIQRIKEEIALVKHPGLRIDHFDTVADQLTDIVESTEKATNTIMEAGERIATTVGQMEAATRALEFPLPLGGLTDDVNRIFEACAFHDLTGQRISKIIRIMNQIEGTLNSLVVIVGQDGIAALPVVPVASDDDHDDGVPLHGPQREGIAISQDEIDKLFG